MLHHIMNIASDSANKQFEMLDRITHNVANVNTAGYKAKRFEQYLRVDGVVDGVERRDTSQGMLMITRRDLDLGIEGDGYLMVTQPDGTVAYTRDGSMMKTHDGYLVTPRGDLIGNGIQVPTNYKKLVVERDGTVKVKVEEKDELQIVGRIRLATFPNDEGLKSIGGNKLVPTHQSGQPQLMTDQSEIKQGYLERSNVNMHHQIDQILRLNAGVISNMKTAKFVDDIYRQAVNLRQ